MKILAVGFNYPSHKNESSSISSKVLSPSSDPIIFHKGDSLHRLGHPYYIPEWTNELEYEAEIVVQINRVGKCISERFAHRYYDNLSIGIDFTARDLQREAIKRGEPWTRSKAFDGSAVVGEWISKQEFNFPEKAIELRLESDNQLVQHAFSDEMIHSIDQIIAYISQQHTLKIGDLIFTGTPAGVGACKIGQKLVGYLNQHKLLELVLK